MSLRGSRHLKQALHEWVAEGLMSAEAAQTLTQRYALEREAPWYLRAGFILSALGIVLGLCGLLLIISQNWAHLGRTGQSAVGLVPLLAAYGYWLWATYRQQADRAELAAFTASALLGINIFLQGQVYHLPGDWPEGTLLWALGALPVGLYLRSSLVHLGTLLLLFVWQLGYYEHTLFGWLGLATIGCALWALRWIRGWPALLLGLAVGWGFVFRLDSWFGLHQLPVFLLLVLLSWATANLLHYRLSVHDERFRRAGVLLLRLSGLVWLYSATFDDFYPEAVGGFPSVSVPLVVVAGAVAGWGKWPRRLGWLLPSVAVLWLGAWAAVHAAPVGYSGAVGVIAATVANLLLFGWALYYIYLGRQTRSRSAFLGGVLVVLLLALTRYVDLYDDYLVAALLFFVASGVLLGANHYWQRYLAKAEGTS